MVFIIPTFIVFTFYTLIPLIYVFIISFKNKTIYQDFGYVYFDNWISVYQDEIFHKIIWNTIIVVIGEVVLLLPLGILLGFLLNKNFKGNSFLRVATFVPYILSGVMVAIIWFFIVDPGVGLINGALNNIGLTSWAQSWIGGTVLTPYTVAIIDSWKTVGFYGLLFLTGLKMLPKDPFEAAYIDGASRLQTTFYITLPLLKETIKICAVMIVINAFNSFQTVKMLTNGGPSDQSHLITTYLYKVNFITNDFGKGSVLATTLFLCVMLISIVILISSRKRIEE